MSKVKTSKTKETAVKDTQAVDIDEIAEYQEGRYVSACEAIWRIFAFLMHAHAPSIVRLQVHLPEEHQVQFRSTDTANAVMAKVPETTLTAWFKLHRQELGASQATQPFHVEIQVTSKRKRAGPTSDVTSKRVRRSDPCSSLESDPLHSATTTKITGKRKREPTEDAPGDSARTDPPEVAARDLLYSDICQHYRFQTRGPERLWKCRARDVGKSIGRMYFVPPTDEERFCLRLLLLKIPGATSFEHLRTVNGVEHETFKKSCLALDLLKGDDEWMDCLNEAKLSQMGPQLRHFFAMILITGSPSKPDVLWEIFAHDLSEDILYRLKDVRPLDCTPVAWQLAQEQKAKSMALFKINEILQSHNSSVSKFLQLPEGFMEDTAVFARNQDAEHEIMQQGFVARSLADVDKLNPGQAAA
ncbi:hypothetical protein KVV02_006666 [Mortierella alpina]|uniref:Uncharacterized protein n=1 Tax=Mortierella alpina TaxID=64518 RepID=A0A9P7ZWB6_MORAP|nr:hypothetical protein KVV02_006666 [Mortierella alpina]